MSPTRFKYSLVPEFFSVFEVHPTIVIARDRIRPTLILFIERVSWFRMQECDVTTARLGRGSDPVKMAWCIQKKH